MEKRGMVGNALRLFRHKEDKGSLFVVKKIIPVEVRFVRLLKVSNQDCDFKMRTQVL